MARSPTTAAAFTAVAEPQRRSILNLLASGERSVNGVCAALGLRQPQASKQRAVLSAVGLATPREAGRQRLYALNARGLKPIHDWVKGFEQFWNESFDRLAEHLKEAQRKGTPE